MDQPWQVEMYRLLSMKYVLRIEVQTGLRQSRGSVLRVVNETLLRNGAIERPLRTKVGALEALEAYLAEKEAAMWRPVSARGTKAPTGATMGQTVYCDGSCRAQ